MEFAHHAPEAYIDEMFGRDAKNESECFKIENDIEGLALVFEDLAALVEELVELEDGVSLFVHEFEEAFDERA